MTSLDVHHTAGATVFLTQNDTRGGRGERVRVCQCELCVDEKNQGWCKTKDAKQAGETEIQQHTQCKREGGERKREEEVIKKTFKGVNSRRVTIPGAASIPPWHSPDKSALMLLIRRGERNGRREVKESAERKGRNRDCKTTEGRTTQCTDTSEVFGKG